jgi:hypothetical protein
VNKSTKWLIGLMTVIGAAVIIGNWPPVYLDEFISGVVIVELMVIGAWSFCVKLLPWIYRKYEINPKYKKYLPLTRRPS